MKRRKAEWFVRDTVQSRGFDSAVDVGFSTANAFLAVAYQGSARLAAFALSTAATAPSIFRPSFDIAPQFLGEVNRWQQIDSQTFHLLHWLATCKTLFVTRTVGIEL